MPKMPSTSRWPRRVADPEQGYFYVDNRDPATDLYDHTGPYVGTITPASGQVQVPGTNAQGNSILVFIDARIWLPLESNVAARSVITNVMTNESFSVIYAQRWQDQIQCSVVRRAP